jgi:lipocalin
MMLVALAISTIAILIVAALDPDVYGPRRRQLPPATVRAVDLDAYMGTWYQMYSSLPNKTFERDATCLYAKYFPVQVPPPSTNNGQVSDAAFGFLHGGK